jgi:hydroxyacylglutathione hydrolase
MLEVVPIAAFRDNYIWLICSQDRDHAAIVDPGDAAPVLCALEQQDITPTALLITHHHGDHIGGIREILTRFPGLEVFGPRHEAIPGITHPLVENDRVEVPGTGLVFRVLDVPGHTAGHIAYFGHGALFCGDTVFSVGCGRLFEGTPHQMHASLSKLAALPADTWMYCAHEYTLDNIGFAKWVEPENLDLLRREQEAFELIDADTPTVPSRLDSELKTNPFLRTDMPGVQRAAETHARRSLASAAEVFAEIRHWKDREYD